MPFKIFILFISAFLSCYILTPVLGKFAQKRGYYSKPTPQKIDKRLIPYFGGISMFLIFSILYLGAMFVFHFSYDKSKIILFLFATGIIVLFGLYDDLREIKPLFKLIGQILGALVLVFFAQKTEIIYLTPFLNILISIFWTVIIINAFNLLDIMDGLAGGISLINIFTFLILGYFTHNNFVLLITSILLGVLVAFLLYNLPPAKIFMGDAGSQFLGFVQAAIAMSLSYARAGKEVGLVIPLVILALPLFDLFFVMLMRFRQKKSIFLKSNDHFVFRMLRLGISNTGILKTMLMLSLLANICALLIFSFSNMVGAIVFFVLIFSLFAFGFKLSRLRMNDA